jgi:hypothetical protein
MLKALREALAAPATPDKAADKGSGGGGGGGEGAPQRRELMQVRTAASLHIHIMYM